MLPTMMQPLLFILSVTISVRASHSRTRPNIVMIMTDDQDLLLHSLDYMPAVQRHFRDQGTFFAKHYCTIAQCCPSRVSLLTGRAAHNTNVTDVRLPYGGYSRFVEQGFNGQWLPSWFQESGYNTYYTGKLMNNHTVQNYNNPYPKGFNSSDFLVDPGTYIYYNASMQSDQDPPRYITGQYSTDVVAERAVEYMQQASASDRPFFLTVAPIGPHGQTLFPGTPQNPTPLPRFDPPVPARQYADLYQGVKVPRTPSYNNEAVNAPSYFKQLTEWNTTIQDYYDEFHRLRLASLASVDDLVTSIIDSAAGLGIMNNTYFIYTSDNGFHIGQHRLPAGKSCAIEEDINVPFFIRGPGIARNATVSSPTSHTDIAPTLFDLAQITLRDDFDGVPMPIKRRNGRKQFVKQEHVNVEFWGPNFAEGNYGFSLLPLVNNNTYKALRLVGRKHNLLYTVWCTNERELYEMNSDPGQIQNLAVSFLNGETQDVGATTPSGQLDDIHRLQDRLDALLMVLKTCKASSCQRPWSVLHPDGTVSSLIAAMNRKYDSFYQDQPKITFTGCAPGYIRALEGPGADTGDLKVWKD